MLTYHKDIRLPEGFRLPARRVSLAWSVHAKRAAKDDRYGLMTVFDTLMLGECETIEVTIEGRCVRKLVLRTEWDTDHDIVLVVIPETPTHYFVKTVWLNHVDDTHRTLDRSKYVC